MTCDGYGDFNLLVRAHGYKFVDYSTRYVGYLLYVPGPPPQREKRQFFLSSIVNSPQTYGPELRIIACRFCAERIQFSQIVTYGW